MTAKANKLLDDALELSESERAELAERLLESIDSKDDIAEAWAKEIERRLRELDEGKVKGIPWSKVRRQLHRGRNAASKR